MPLNLWPFSNWELFSRLRSDRLSGWEALAVAGTGRVRAFPVGSLPGGYRSFDATLRAFSERSATARNARCAEWLRDATTDLGMRTRDVRIYRVRWRLSDRRGSHAAPGHLTLSWICTAKGAHEA